ncbi:hypothetical protein [Desulfallas thermosapovorans]|uniref:hypothetical protein n=1 Tax=Desulfallas thermosapovorans TaxID=58137 RepID=UPI001412ABDB|nr:hypothetical protein [Desulfallas thermosapovorans]
MLAIWWLFQLQFSQGLRQGGVGQLPGIVLLPQEFLHIPPGYALLFVFPSLVEGAELFPVPARVDKNFSITASLIAASFFVTFL